MKYFLVVGGTGVMGTSAIEAVREYFGHDIVIIANFIQIDHINNNF